MTFVDQELAHITHAMALSLETAADTGAPVFPAAYWRERLRQLIDRHHLQYDQLCTVDTLLCLLERAEARPRHGALHTDTVA